MTTTPCKGCGRPVVWCEVAGKPVPLDPTPPIWRVFPGESFNPPSNATTAERAPQKVTETYIGPLYMVSHFTTCAKANEFSRSNANRGGNL